MASPGSTNGDEDNHRDKASTDAPDALSDVSSLPPHVSMTSHIIFALAIVVIIAIWLLFDQPWMWRRYVGRHFRSGPTSINTRPAYICGPTDPNDFEKCRCVTVGGG